MSNYILIYTEEAISKTARVLEEADISEEKRDVIHREIGKFRESMKVSRRRLAPPCDPLPYPVPSSSHRTQSTTMLCTTLLFNVARREARYTPTQGI